jgi:hypothetical protein
MAGMHRTAAASGPLPTRKRAATAEILRQIREPIAPDLACLRDRALLLLGFAGALRRAELAAIRVAHLAPCEGGLRLTLPHSKGERTGRGVSVAIPYGTTDLCPIRALRALQDAAGITEGAVFRRIWTPPRGRDGRKPPCPASVAKSQARHWYRAMSLLLADDRPWALNRFSLSSSSRPRR